MLWSCVKGVRVYVKSGANVWNETENKASPVEHYINEDAEMTIVNFRCIFWMFLAWTKRNLEVLIKRLSYSYTDHERHDHPRQQQQQKEERNIKVNQKWFFLESTNCLLDFVRKED